MKAVLKFDLDNPDDKLAHRRCVQALDLCLTLYNITEVLRKYRKHVDLNEEQYKLFEKLDEEIFEVINRYNIDMDELIN